MKQQSTGQSAPRQTLQGPRRALCAQVHQHDIELLVEMDKAHEDVRGPAIVHLLKRAYKAYGDARYVRLAHLSPSHLYNLRKSAGYKARRMFIPSVGNFEHGMLVRLLLHLDLLPGKPLAIQLHDALVKLCAGGEWFTVERVEAAAESGKLDALALIGTKKMELRVFGNESNRYAVLVARLDNLGKDASGLAVQKPMLILGL